MLHLTETVLNLQCFSLKTHAPVKAKKNENIGYLTYFSILMVLKISIITFHALVLNLKAVLMHTIYIYI